jgi:hypothetical protein
MNIFEKSNPSLAFAKTVIFLFIFGSIFRCSFKLRSMSSSDHDHPLQRRRHAAIPSLPPSQRSHSYTRTLAHGWHSLSLTVRVSPYESHRTTQYHLFPLPPPQLCHHFHSCEWPQTAPSWWRRFRQPSHHCVINHFVQEFKRAQKRDKGRRRARDASQTHLKL